jgi:hypothetical protein
LAALCDISLSISTDGFFTGEFETAERTSVIVHRRQTGAAEERRSWYAYWHARSDVSRMS